MSNKNIIFIGGTGLIGSSVLNYLSKENKKVYSLTRNPTEKRSEFVEEIILNFNSMELSKEISNWDHIYICLGRRIKIWELLYVRKKDREEHYKIEHDYILNVLKKGKKLGGKSISIISAIGANPKSSNFYLKTKGMTEESIKLLGYENINILRPGHIITNKEINRTNFLIWLIDIFSKFSNPFLFGPLRRYRGIQLDIISKFMAKKDCKGLNIFYYDDFIS